MKRSRTFCFSYTTTDRGTKEILPFYEQVIRNATRQALRTYKNIILNFIDIRRRCMPLA